MKYLYILIIFIFTGCNSIPVNVNLQTAPDYHFDKTKPVAVLNAQPITIENKKIVANFFNLIENQNFNTKLENNAEYVFSIQVEDSSFNKIDSYNIPVYENKKEYSTVNGYTYTHINTNITSYQTQVETITKHYKTYTLKLFSILNSNKNLIWTGKAVLNSNYNYENMEKVILNRLLNSLGKEFKGNIYITQEELLKFK